MFEIEMIFYFQVNAQIAPKIPIIRKYNRKIKMPKKKKAFVKTFPVIVIRNKQSRSRLRGEGGGPRRNA